MRLAPKAPLWVLIAGLALAQSGCRSGARPWVPPQDFNVTIVSDATFVQTRQGEYLDGYLADYEERFEKRQMFMALELPHYVKGDRLIITARRTEDFVRIPAEGLAAAEVPVFVIERAKPNIPAAPNIPALK